MREGAQETAKSTKKSSKAADFFAGVKSEFRKISWPDRNSTFKQSVAVVAISLVLGVIIAALDFVIQMGVNFLTNM